MEHYDGKLNKNLLDIAENFPVLYEIVKEMSWNDFNTKLNKGNRNMHIILKNVHKLSKISISYFNFKIFHVFVKICLSLYVDKAKYMQSIEKIPSFNDFYFSKF